MSGDTQGKRQTLAFLAKRKQPANAADEESSSADHFSHWPDTESW
jgi:hypothetical protein